jgi:hypothetical protein
MNYHHAGFNCRSYCYQEAISIADRAAEVARNLGAESTMYEAEVLALLGAAIEGRTSGCNHQVVTGMRIPPDRTKLPFWTTDAKFKRLREEQRVVTLEDTSKLLNV